MKQEKLDSERERVRDLIFKVLPNQIVDEVGSSAVDGVIGKGDLDFALAVPKPQFQTVIAALDRQFKRNFNQFSSTEFQGYSVDSDIDIAIQVFIKGGSFDNFNRFRDMLRADLVLKQSYNNLKRAWNGRDMQEYRGAKAKFIEMALSSSALARPD